MANLRPDLKQYVGEAGYLFNSISEARDIISKPFPEEKRQLGFEHAKKSDVAQHKLILDTLWNHTLCAPDRIPNRVNRGDDAANGGIKPMGVH